MVLVSLLLPRLRRCKVGHLGVWAACRQGGCGSRKNTAIVGLLNNPLVEQATRRRSRASSCTPSTSRRSATRAPGCRLTKLLALNPAGLSREPGRPGAVTVTTAVVGCAECAGAGPRCELGVVAASSVATGHCGGSRNTASGIPWLEVVAPPQLLLTLRTSLAGWFVSVLWNEQPCLTLR